MSAGTLAYHPLISAFAKMYEHDEERRKQDEARIRNKRKEIENRKKQERFIVPTWEENKPFLDKIELIINNTPYTIDIDKGQKEIFGEAYLMKFENTDIDQIGAQYDEKQAMCFAYLLGKKGSFENLGIRSENRYEGMDFADFQNDLTAEKILFLLQKAYKNRKKR